MQGRCGKEKKRIDKQIYRCRAFLFKIRRGGGGGVQNEDNEEYLRGGGGASYHSSESENYSEL